MKIHFSSKIRHYVDRLSYDEMLVVLGLIIMGNACIYTLLSYVPGSAPTGITGELVERFLSSLYFSVITATSTGFGDIVPHGLSRFFAALEALMGIFSFAMLLTKLLSFRQDRIIAEMHEMALDGTLRDARQDLFTVRTDFKNIAHTLQKDGRLSHRDWSILSLAIHQCVTVFQDLHALYRGSHHDYETLKHHELLIIEAAHRTLARLKHLLTIFEKNTIAWKDHPALLQETSHLVREIKSLHPIWMKGSPQHQELAEAAYEAAESLLS